MKLLSKKSAQAQIKKENEELVETNIRLRGYEKEIRERLNTIKTDYTPDKVQRLKEFEVFCLDLQKKKSVLLEEYDTLAKAVEAKKEIYYGMVAKKDALAEREYQLNEKESKLNLRALFVEELENKWKEEELLI